MSKTSEQPSTGDRRHATREHIDRLLEGRQAMWLLYERLAGVGPYANRPEPNRLHEFVQVLVDYIAAGHFGLYERIVSGQERRQAVLDTAQKLYPQIASTTDVAVAFNDKYESKDPIKVTEELSRDLSSLGESLATRTELEDQLIARLFAS